MALPQDETDLQDPTLPKKRQQGGFPDPAQFGAEFTGQPSGGFLGTQPSPVASFDSGSAAPKDLSPQSSDFASRLPSSAGSGSSSDFASQLPGANSGGGGNMQYLHGGPALGTNGYGVGGEGGGRAWATGTMPPTPYDPWKEWGNGPGKFGTTDNPSAGTGSYSDAQHNALLSQLRGGQDSGGSPPYIGGQGDPNAGRIGAAVPSGNPRSGPVDDYAQRTRDLGGRSLVGTAGDPGAPAPPSTQPATSQPSASGGTGRDWFMNWTQGKAPNKETLLANKDELAAHGYTLVPNATMGPDGKPTNYDIRDSSGRIVDVVVGGSRGGEAWQYDDSGGGPAAGGSAGGGYGQSSFSGGGYGDAIHDALVRLLSRGEGTVNATDPLIAGATGAYRQQADRSLRHSRNMLAERSAAEGLNSGGEGSGAFDSALQSQQEQEGRDVGSFQSGLMLDENRQRRGDVTNAIQAMLAHYGLGQQNQQFYDTMGYNMGRDEMQQNYLYNSLLGG